jgi:hypothetical protein
MYVNDTDGIGNIELEAESDISYTSLGGPSRLNNFIKASGGSYYAPLKRWILTGRFIPVSKLRVISPCFAQGTCPGSNGPSANIRARIAAIRHARRAARRRHGLLATMHFLHRA